MMIDAASLRTHYLVTRVEDLTEIITVSFEHLATLLCHGVEDRLDDFVLVKVESVGVRVSTLHS
jgi:hypothetical protein